MHTCVIDLEDYTYKARASILYNHVYSAPLPQDVKETFADPRVYRPIIEHRNFNPRIVAVTLADSGLLSGRRESLVGDLIANLEDPHRIWDHIVKNQIGETDVKLLKLVLSFMSDMLLDDLQEIWMECDESLRDLQRALGMLDGTMLKSVQNFGNLHIGFHNPSVRDYLVNYVQSDMGEVISLISLVKRFEQLEAFWLVFPAPGGGPMAETYRKRRDQLEEVASAVFHSEPVNLGEPERGKDYVRRSWLCLEMGKDIESEVIHTLGLEAAADEDTVLNAFDSTGLWPLLQTLSQDKTTRGGEVLFDCISWSVEWIMGDLSDWNPIMQAQDFLLSIDDYDPGTEVSEALDRIESVRDYFAEEAFEDWAQTHRDPVGSASEMRQIIEYYENSDSSSPFDTSDYDAVLQRLEGFDAAHQTPTVVRNGDTGLTWNAAREVQSMMQALRSRLIDEAPTATT
ncbi:hypothetical protein [Streptomyces avermitilis]|uniref:hypothetical protein n=1 Tax=Streptomyces avermitilis TaxID=33903 RepID=UPI00380A2385